MSALALDIPDELVDVLAERVATRLADRQPAPVDDGRWLRGACAIAEYLGCSPSRVYSLSSSRRIPVEHDGAQIVAKTSVLDDWVRAGGDRCPAGGRR